ncbi:MAG: FAD-dependent oxidoreductase [Psychromonas sp.]|nr:FAD-dependent oxidoreductase [Psychromonas sp.]
MKKIAIVGAGISGLTCAHLLHKKHHIELFEAGDYLGGHTATKEVVIEGRSWHIDTGFIVFNDRTYANFEKLLKRIGIGRRPTQMSFSVSHPGSTLEYNGSTLNGLFAQRRNLFNFKFLKLIKEILAFNHRCTQDWQTKQINKVMTLGSFLDKYGFSDYFAEHYILPMGAAIWSSSLADMRDFPLYFFVRFFQHHGLLSIRNRPQWYVIPDGSSSYIKPLCTGFENNIHLNSPVEQVMRDNCGVKIKLAGQDWQAFDEIILACHSDQSKTLLIDISDTERSILSAIEYQQNQVVLHTDRNLLPRNRRAWAAWNYHLNNDHNSPAAVTYNMNILQNLPSDAPLFCISLNQSALIAPDKILQSFQYAHPVFNQGSIEAQARRNEICGKKHTHFAGAYWYNGFHEDGVKSAVDVCARFGVQL